MIDKTQPRDWSEAIERLVTFHRTTYGMHQMRREALAILREFDGQNQQDLNDLLEKAMQFTMCDIDSADMVKYFVKKHKEKWREFLDNNDEQTEEPIEQVADDIDVVSKEQAAQGWCVKDDKNPVIMPTDYDPYNDIKPVHFAKMIRSNGDMSPLCADKPRRINLKKETWTINKRFVTCKKCKIRLKAQAAEPRELLWK